MASLVSVGRWKDWRLAVLPYVQGIKVLEIGFGTGHLQGELIHHGLNVFGLDESPQMVRIARKNTLKNGIDPRLAIGYAQFLPFPASSFDSLVATFPSEYIMEERTLAEIFRVLKFSGRLIIVPIAWITGSSAADLAAKWLFRVTGQTTEDKTGLEIKIRSILGRAGFQVQIVAEQLPDSLVMIVIAEKPIEPGKNSTYP